MLDEGWTAGAENEATCQTRKDYGSTLANESIPEETIADKGFWKSTILPSPTTIANETVNPTDLAVWQMCTATQISFPSA